MYTGGAKTELNIKPHRHLVGIPNEMLRENGKFENYYYCGPRISKQSLQAYVSLRHYTAATYVL